MFAKFCAPELNPANLVAGKIVCKGEVSCIKKIATLVVKLSSTV